MRPATHVPRRRLGSVQLAAGAAWTLGGNDIGSMITAAPRLYPHMWSWDTAFISIGLAHLNVDRAVRELETLLTAQWRNGMLPHIVFSEGGGYFPGPQRWGAAELNADAPDAPRTSGICQPPVHAIALRRIVDIGRGSPSVDRLLREGWPRLYHWHEWLVRHRDPHGTGLLAIVHGWESGMDNSPRWDVPYAAVVPGAELPPYVRRDRGLVSHDDAERPSDREYDRYLWLIEEMRKVRYDADQVVRTSSFLVGDVFVTALFALTSEVLATLGEESGRPAWQVRQLRGWARCSRAAVAAAYDPVSGLARDLNLRTDEWLSTRTIVGFAPLLCGGLEDRDEERMLETIRGPSWAGHPDLFAAIPPSVSPDDPGFRPREYWRGPVWPVIAWLFGWAFEQRGWTAHAARLRTECLRLVEDGTFAEYYHPLTGEPLGSKQQSWTATVVLDWLHTAL
ncbi:glycogen debranching protein [Actinophytocola sp.]|uniref:glucosylglycerate hydrolase n=1 Tax=Actinophytocola sp. TaxID=1872138 RepID=UPI0025C639FE|nr:glycogen debranching protein [Actinophytocola sp.]